MNSIDPTKPPDHETVAERALASADWYYDWSDDINARERGLQSYQKAIDVLEVVALQDRDKARALWERHAPKETQAPSYLLEGEVPKRQDLDSSDGKNGLENESDPTSYGTERVTLQPPDYVPTSVTNRYLQVGKSFHYRDREGVMAFEDGTKKLSTPHEDVHVIRAMLEVAEARGWTSVRIKGANRFKRAAWLQASLRGLEVEGVKPDEIDQAKLADARRSDVHQRNDPGRLTPQTEVDQSLSRRETSTVEVLKAVLRGRGDSEVAVDMAAEIARQRFLTNRVYVGKVTEIGEAPYQNNPDSGDSPYVRIETSGGNRQIWGVDLPRALQEGQIKLGDDIALAFQGKQRVEVTVRTRDEDGKPIARKEMVDRNTWEARRLDDLRDEVRQRLIRAGHAEPTVQVYDRNAPRIVEPSERIKRSRRGMERTR